MADDVTRLVREVARWPGWRIKPCRDGWMFMPADLSLSPIVVHSSESDPRAMANTKSRLRRAGGPL